jgi:hypothetical protein
MTNVTNVTTTTMKIAQTMRRMMYAPTQLTSRLSAGVSCGGRRAAPVPGAAL